MVLGLPRAKRADPRERRYIGPEKELLCFFLRSILPRFPEAVRPFLAGLLPPGFKNRESARQNKPD